MRRTNAFAALAAGILVFAAASAPAQGFRLGFGHDRGLGRPHRPVQRPINRPVYRPVYRPFYPGYSRFGSGFGFGFGFGNSYRTRSVGSTTYRNAFTGDVTYAERAVNDFRSAYEKQRGDRLGVKADVQRLDETLERMRREAETYGAVTFRGSDLAQTALSQSDRINRRFRDEDNDLADHWKEVRRIVERLARTYRTEG
ncbi:hypothetical protein EON81_00960 [bacterium]|nr:MAG: hypothetical protein EON81_00960 [bacterium]